MLLPNRCRRRAPSAYGYSNTTATTPGRSLRRRNLGTGSGRMGWTKTAFHHPNAAVLGTDNIAADKKVAASMPGPARAWVPRCSLKTGGHKAVAHTAAGLQPSPRGEGEKDRFGRPLGRTRRRAFRGRRPAGFRWGSTSSFHLTRPAANRTVMQAPPTRDLPNKVLGYARFLAPTPLAWQQPRGRTLGDYHPDQKETTRWTRPARGTDHGDEAAAPPVSPGSASSVRRVRQANRPEAAFDAIPC